MDNPFHSDGSCTRTLIIIGVVEKINVFSTGIRKKFSDFGGPIVNIFNRCLQQYTTEFVMKSYRSLKKKKNVEMFLKFLNDDILSA